MAAVAGRGGQSVAASRPLTFGLVLLAVAVWAGLGPAPQALVFDRTAIAAGEIWRLVSGHFVHSDAAHAVWDIAALALIGLLLEDKRLPVALAAGIAAVDACLWWGLPELERYCGLSGMLNALLVVALADLWRSHRHPAIPLAWVVLAGKLAAEAFMGQSLVVTTAWPGVPQAHLAGCLGGLVVALTGPAGKGR